MIASPTSICGGSNIKRESVWAWLATSDGAAEDAGEQVGPTRIQLARHQELHPPYACVAAPSI